MAEGHTARRSVRLRGLRLQGREYLSDCLHWTIPQLEQWIQAPYIQPHLQHWYLHCVMRVRYYNVVLDLINTGRYQKPDNDFERDILLECFCLDMAGVPADTGKFIKTDNDYEMIVQLWAKAAHKIIEQSDGRDSIITYLLKRHPAKAYHFAIDLISIAFHGIAYRGRNSCYEALINGDDALADAEPSDVDDDDYCSDDTLSASESEYDNVKVEASNSDEETDIDDDKSEGTTEVVSNTDEEDDEHEVNESESSAEVYCEHSSSENESPDCSAWAPQSSLDEAPSEKLAQGQGLDAKPGAASRGTAPPPKHVDEASAQPSESGAETGTLNSNRSKQNLPVDKSRRRKSRAQQATTESHTATAKPTNNSAKAQTPSAQNLVAAKFAGRKTSSRDDYSNDDLSVTAKQEVKDSLTENRSSNRINTDAHGGPRAGPGRKYASNTDRRWSKALFDSDTD